MKKLTLIILLILFSSGCSIMVTYKSADTHMNRSPNLDTQAETENTLDVSTRVNNKDTIK